MAQELPLGGDTTQPGISIRAELRALATVESGSGNGVHATRRRPLGPLSDFVCEGLGEANDAVRRRELSPDDLLRIIDNHSSNIDEATMRHLVNDTASRRVASVDLAFAERAVDIAHGESVAYREQRRGLDVFRKAAALAELDERQPVLTWSDIAIGHPIGDPRSFLDRGHARDQEILMYRIQSGIERTFKKFVTEWPDTVVTASWLADLHADIDAVVEAMIHLTRVREPGQFYKLDPFLGANRGVRGHGTGSFSAWTFLAGWFLTGRDEFRFRVCDPANLAALDPDARLYIRAAACLGVATLVERAPEGGRSPQVGAVQAAFYDFLKVHRGAIRKHAAASFDDAAPANPSITNAESMRRSLDENF